MRGSMQDTLLLILMTLIALSHLILVYHCSLWRKERGDLTSVAGDWASDVKTKLQCLDDSVDILSEIADILESGGGGAVAESPLNWQQLATQAIMARMNVGASHGSTQEQEDRPDDEIQQTQNEQIQGSGIGSSDIGDSS